MQFVYIGDGNDAPRKITFMGEVNFELNGDAVDVTDPALIKKLKGNTNFESLESMPTIEGSCEEVEEEVPTKTEDPAIEPAKEPSYQEMVAFIKDKGLKVLSAKKEDVKTQYEALLEDGD